MEVTGTDWLLVGPDGARPPDQSPDALKPVVG